MKYQIELKVSPYKIKDFAIVRIPREESNKFTSRGQVMVEGLINGEPIFMPLEPDGNFGHWFNLNDLSNRSVDLNAPIDLRINQTTSWIEPKIPNDIKKAIKTEPAVFRLWKTITPLARWEWVRWINSTASEQTRAKRINVALDKMNKGEKRPCCWNRNLCTEPSVSKNGVLLS